MGYPFKNRHNHRKNRINLILLIEILPLPSEPNSMIFVFIILSILLFRTAVLLLYKGNVQFGFCYKKSVFYSRTFHAPTIWQLGKNNFDR
jgi:hypothetical protein